MRYRMAIAYDFDKTLVPGNMQEQFLLRELEIAKEVFWNEVGKIVRKQEMDEVLAYMYLLVEKMRSKKYKKEDICKHGRGIKYFPGVEEWFLRITKYAEERDVALEHYVISSGNKEIIAETTIAEHFKAIYASSFMYDADGYPTWPALAVNFTNKTQYLFRINKGITQPWENEKLNEYMPEKERHIPFPNMIYIGDGLTDVPAMKMINYKGGYSIVVHTTDQRSIEQANKLLKHERVQYKAKADYTKGEELDQIVKSIISRVALRERVRHLGKGT